MAINPWLRAEVHIYETCLWTQLTRQALEAREIKALIAPPYYWGINVTTQAFPGSFTVRNEPMKAILYDLNDSWCQWGFKHVFSFNLHGDSTHIRLLADALIKINAELGIRIIKPSSQTCSLRGENH
jgi:creatinine amidohydrolase